MTDPLDAALDTSSPLFDVARIDVDWKESLPGYGAWARGVNAPDNISDLGQQLGPDGWAVSQSLIDGLPDPVAMTAGNDGFGSMEADLIGRNANRAETWGLKTPRRGSGSAATLTVPAPTDSDWGDYQLVAVAIDSASDIVATVDPYNRNDWALLSTAVDGAVKLWVYGRRWYTGATDLALTFPGTVNYAWITESFWASAAVVGTTVDLMPGTPVTLSETVSGTGHTLPVQDLNGRGWTIAFWVTPSAAGQWTVPGPDLEVSEEPGAVLDLSMSRSVTQQSAMRRAMVNNTNTATATVAAVGIPLMFRERPSLSTSAYFSPYSTDSPLYGFARDNADVKAYQVTVTADSGPVSTNTFTGQMSDIAVRSSSNTAGLTATSKTRVLMDRARTPPPIWGRLEGLTLDWFANWLMANGGQTVGPGPTTKTRTWIPYYGSSKPFSWSPQDWTPVERYTSADPGVAERHFTPEAVEGPYVGGMFGCYTNDLVVQPRINADRVYRFAPIPGIDNPDNYDAFSQANNEGRVSFWFRADPFLTGATLPAALTDPALQHLFRFQLEGRSNLLTNGVSMGGVILTGDPTTGTGGASFRVSMGTESGYSTGTPSWTWPTDGLWHFVCMSWNFFTAEMKIRMDTNALLFTGYSTAGPTNLTKLAPTEDQLYQSGGFMLESFRSNLPISDFQVEVGPGMHSQFSSRFWPKPAPAAVYRSTNVPMTALYESAPVSGWDTLLEVGKATLSAIRCNEQDQIEFLPQTYFGETDQTVIEWIADTETNASAMDVKQDPSKSRNSVTLNFSETFVDGNVSEILAFRSSILLLPGVAYYTFQLDRPCVELHGANSPATGSFYDLIPLTAAQLATPSLINNFLPYMTINIKADGSGGVPPASFMKGRIMGQPDANSVVIRFTNTTNNKYYLVNSGSDTPYIRLLGYGVKANAAYTTVRDDMSVRLRNERTLTHDNRWIQQRPEAVTLAASITNVIAYPRGEINVTVMGDPRRTPGRLVQIIDSEGTQAEGIWRILAIGHDSAGPQYTQNLQLVRVGSTMIWDGFPGWDQGVWGE